MHINVHRTILSKRPFRALSVLVISLTKNPPLRHHAAEGNTTSLLNPISGYRIRLSTLSRDEIRDQCASRGEGTDEIRGREKQSHSLPGVQEPKESRIEDGRVAGAPVSRIESIPGTLNVVFHRS